MDDGETKEEKIYQDESIATRLPVLFAFLLASFSYKYSNDSRQMTLADVYVQSAKIGRTY